MSGVHQEGLRIAIAGSTGRMGLEISSLAGELGIVVTGAVSSKSPVSSLNPSAIDIVIDFSLPHLTKEVADWCMAHQKPLVSGVTGLDAELKAYLAKASSSIPVLWAPNMSLGVAVLARLLSGLAALDGFDFQIEEAHHVHKKDKPSGTALFLQERLRKAVKKELPEPLALRGGAIFGIHKVWAMGAEETVTLEHTAMNRRVFARGALRAASWIRYQKPGLYSMDDVLDFATTQP